MKRSNYLIPTMVNNPTDCDTEAQSLMLRSGMLKKVSSGLYVYLPTFLRVVNKITAVIREEMENVGASEVKFPILVAKETLTESNRWDAYGKEMFKLKDRNEREYALSPTNEEAGCFMAKNYVTSYKDLPFAVYQIQQKHRDEIRPRAGVVRAREFIMKDAYSFHTTDEDLIDFYNKMKEAYIRIFEKLELDVVAVRADSGAIGGDMCEEVMAISSAGEAEIAFCKDCSQAWNVEAVECFPDSQPSDEEEKQIEKLATPNVKTIEQLAEFAGVSATKIVKSVVFSADGNLVVALVRGDREVNDAKLGKLTKAALLELATEEQILKELGSILGFVGPVGLKNVKIYADFEVQNMKNFVVGANLKDMHFINVNLRDFECEFVDLRNAVDGDVCPICKKEKLDFAFGNELGHIFNIGKRYTDPLKITYVDNQGKDQVMTMGCYGIGIERVVNAIVEKYGDENGINWPIKLAPFAVNIITVDIENEVQKMLSEKIYNNLKASGIEVIWDDRKERVGYKFKDSELIGFPINIVVGKFAGENKVEFGLRLQDKKLVLESEVLDLIKDVLK